MNNLFNVFGDEDKRHKSGDIAGKLEDFAKEIRDTADGADKYTAEAILLMRRSQAVRRRLCEAALTGRLSEEQLIEICRYFEDELKKIEEFEKKLSGNG